MEEKDEEDEGKVMFKMEKIEKKAVEKTNGGNNTSSRERKGREWASIKSRVFESDESSVKVNNVNKNKK